jgi:thioredoxin 1
MHFHIIRVPCFLDVSPSGNDMFKRAASRLKRTVMIEVNNKRDLDSKLRKNQSVLALFYASWCPYCKSFLKVFDEALLNSDFTCVIRVSTDDYDNPLWDDYSVEAVPTVILFNNGKVRARLDGRLGEGLNEKQFKMWLENLSQ